jgi:predicted acetyltransferase
VSIEIRNAQPAEYGAFIDAVSTAFLDRPDVAKIAETAATLWEPARTWAAFDDGRVCGTFRSWATELTVPGGAALRASAIAAVTVLPTHRRRGILTRLAAAEHAAIRERGEVVGLLYASEWPIYGRFGYGPATRTATLTLDAARTGFHGPEATGIELATQDEALAETLRGVFEAWRRHQPGEIWRREFRWLDDVGVRDSGWRPRWKGFIAVHRDRAGEADGYARYRTEEKWVNRQPASTIVIDELHALNEDAATSLWRFLAEVDLVATVSAGGRSPSDRLPWRLVNGRAASASEIGDGLWIRLFDVPRALGARTYEREDRLVLEVIDPELTAPIRVALDASRDGVTCTPTDRTPDLTVPIAALGAAYLGGTRLGSAVIATGADEHVPGALARADALLRTADEPWCSTFF